MEKYVNEIKESKDIKDAVDELSKSSSKNCKYGVEVQNSSH